MNAEYDLTSLFSVGVSEHAKHKFIDEHSREPKATLLASIMMEAGLESCAFGETYVSLCFC